MGLTTFDKNRMTIAAVLTAIALPVIFIASASPQNASQTTVAPSTSTTYDVGLSTDTDKDAPANLGGPVSPDQNGQGQIAYPADNSGRMIRGTASFRRLPDTTKTGCSTNLVPLGATITVRNLNNGRKVDCININIGPLPAGFDIVVNTALFEIIAELIDAPLPVEMTW